MWSNSLPSARSHARFHARTLTPAVVQVVFAAAALAALEVALMYSATPAPPWQVLMFPIVAGVYVAAGTIAWVRRPNNRIGPLLTATGFVWIAAGLFNVPINALVAVGFITATVPLAMVVHLLHAFPSGRLRGRLSFWTVITGYSNDNVLSGVVGLSTTNALAVGSYDDGSLLVPLAVHCC
jgi:hypothetical protein